MEEIVQVKCKNCGAALDLALAQNGVVTCEYCYSAYTLAKKQTAPKALEFLSMGEHELDVCEFDNAYKAFQKAADEAPEEPEAYFGMALASAKVQYLRDIVNNRLQPICHEVSIKRFSDDDNYKKALSLATQEQKAEYQRKAEEIESIAREFYKLGQSGLQYDCFLCVKVTDGNRHTEDSVWALSLYHKLKAAGLKPFYSEEEMAGRTGADYEALILYALHVSRCMLVICSEERYLKTPWVENEYTRFIGMLHDEEKSRDSLTVVFGDKPIERLPGMKGRIQGIKYNSFDALERILTFVRRFTLDDDEKRREEEEELKKQEELRRQTEEMAQQMEEMRRQMEEMKKATAPKAVPAPKPQPKPEQQPTPKSAPELKLEPKLMPKIEPQPMIARKAEETELEFEFEKVNSGYFLSKYIGHGTNCIVPNEYKGEKIIGIGRKAFRNSGLTHIKISDGVMLIADRAFADNNALMSIELPESIVIIGSGAFYRCGKLTDFSIPERVRTIGNAAFSCCGNLQRIIIPKAIKIIEGYAFYGCKSLNKIIIPPNVLEIGESAFEDCTGLSEVVVASGVKLIGKNAFRQCHNLETVVFKNILGWRFGLMSLNNAELSDPVNAAELLKTKSGTWTRN